MKNEPSARRKKLQGELAQLKEKAIVELELRGYDVRGKTPNQIRRMLKNRPQRPK